MGVPRYCDFRQGIPFVSLPSQTSLSEPSFIIGSLLDTFLSFSLRKLGPKEGVVSVVSQGGQAFSFSSEEILGKSALFSFLLLVDFGRCLDSKRSDEVLVAAEVCRSSNFD